MISDVAEDRPKRLGNKKVCPPIPTDIFNALAVAGERRKLLEDNSTARDVRLSEVEMVVSVEPRADLGCR
jgi:hypothetical protein